MRLRSFLYYGALVAAASLGIDPEDGE